MGEHQLRIAIFGGGRMAAQHAAAIRTLSEGRLVAVADPFLSREQCIERFGPDVDFYPSPEDLLEKCRPDVVHIVSPPETHTELARLALHANAHIYVEKPFALSASDAAAVLELAASKKLRVCAAHQVLFQPAGQKYQDYLGIIGRVVHVESYFSFKPVRRRPDGGAPLSAVDQLIDILPHPVYLMLNAFEGDQSSPPEVTALDVIPEGEVRAVVRCGTALATLIVSLRARPVESYLRVVGTNGSVEADFILGSVVKSLGPGASGPALAVKPFSQAIQLFGGSFVGLVRRLLRKQRSYPGLSELIGAYYSSIRANAAPPISERAVLRTVQICEAVSARLQAVSQEAEAAAEQALRARTLALPPTNPTRGVILVTGGSGFLGRHVLQELRNAGWPVRAVVRRLPPASRRIPGIEYVTADLSDGLTEGIFDQVDLVVHLAAETAGDKAAHQRNTIDATRKLVESMTRSGVSKLINVSSVAVLRPLPRPLREDSEVDRDNLGRGPYVWAKAEAESLAISHAAQTGMKVLTLRLGPLIDWTEFTPPGRLGREVARLYVAMGSKKDKLSVCDVRTAARTITSYAENFSTAPAVLNLLETPAPTRGDLVAKLRETRPDLYVLWMPFPMLKVLSLVAVLLQKLLRPGQKPVELYSAFEAQEYDTTLAREVLGGLAGPPSQS